MSNVFKLSTHDFQVSKQTLPIEARDEAERYSAAVNEAVPQVQALFDEFVAKAAEIAPKYDLTPFIDEKQKELKALEAERDKALSKAESGIDELEKLKISSALQMRIIAGNGVETMISTSESFSELKALEEIAKNMNYNSAAKRAEEKAKEIAIGTLDQEIEATKLSITQMTQEQTMQNNLWLSLPYSFGYVAY